MNPLVLASNNQKKLTELSQLLQPFGFTLQPQAALKVPEIAETGFTFVENALLKARNACHHTGYAAVADDSGLVVDALDGRPGLYSARYAGEQATDQDNLDKVIHELKALQLSESTARYVCVIVYLRFEFDPAPIICQGFWEGRVVTTPAGDQGFGYDPIFWVPDHQCTAAQLTAATKNAISHRGQAITQLLKQLS